jgi:hypothetical protein
MDKICPKKKYKLNNADAIKEWSNTKVVCECGGSYTLTNKSKHIASAKHRKYIKQLEADIIKQIEQLQQELLKIRS